jgi:hypothetical protein
MAWLPPDFSEALQGLETEKYVFVKCLVCQSVYRWGIYGFQEGAVHCPICGAVTWNPKLVSKMDYLHFLQKMGSVKNLADLQKKLWDYRRSDENQQRR